MAQASSKPSGTTTAQKRRSRKVENGTEEAAAAQAKTSQLQKATHQAEIAAAIKTGVQKSKALRDIQTRAAAETELRMQAQEYEAAIAAYQNSENPYNTVDFSQVFEGDPDIDRLLTGNDDAGEWLALPSYEIGGSQP